MQPRVDALLRATVALFDLPHDSKHALAASLSPLHRGWTGVGGAHNCSSSGRGGTGPDNKESFLLGERRAALREPAFSSAGQVRLVARALLAARGESLTQPSCARSTPAPTHGA
jgi:isopenicillin N synthase-like dioxygenase